MSAPLLPVHALQSVKLLPDGRGVAHVDRRRLVRRQIGLVKVRFTMGFWYILNSDVETAFDLFLSKMVRIPGNRPSISVIQSLKSEDTLEVDSEAVHGGRDRSGLVQGQLPSGLATRMRMRMSVPASRNLLPGKCRPQEVGAAAAVVDVGLVVGLVAGLGVVGRRVWRGAGRQGGQGRRVPAPSHAHSLPA